ncbi:MAG: ATP-dependent Clp protease ATP-binding subunit [Patescibacteria group bacterium]
MFDLFSSRVYRALHYPIRVIIPFEIVCGMLALFFLLVFLFPRPDQPSGSLSEAHSLGMFLALMGVNTWLVLLWVFYDLKLRRTRVPMPITEAAEYVKHGGTLNTAEYLDFSAARALYQALRYAAKKNSALSSAVLLRALCMHERTDFLFQRLLLKKEDFVRSIEVIVGSQYKLDDARSHEEQALDAVMARALAHAAESLAPSVTVEHIFSVIVMNDRAVQRIFFDLGVTKDDVAHVLRWEEQYHEERKPKPLRVTFAHVKGIADDWAYGYTPTLDGYGRTVAVRTLESEEHMHVLAHEQEIDAVETILDRSGRNNVILVGEAGVGKKSVVQGFAQRLLYGTTRPSLLHKRVVALDVNLVIARSHDNASAVGLLDQIFAESDRAGNVVLVVENFHNIVGPQRKENVASVDVTGVLVPYLQSDTFQMIALVEPAPYHTHVEAIPSLSILFEKVDVLAPDEERTLLILEDMTPQVERTTGVFISYFALAEVVSAAESFIQNIPFPAKAISLLAEVVSFAGAHRFGGLVVTQDHVMEVVSKKTGIPLGRLSGEEKAKLLNMEALLHQRIVGQGEAIGQIASALRRIRAGIGERKRPIGTFLFLGSTGVGKTETAKALADVYFGSEERMIRLDMTEYQDAASIHRLIGNTDTDVAAQFADRIREQPFSLVLLDELEKAHPNVQNLFLQVLDEGRLTDAFQKHISFRNTIIIATSNAGSEFIREYVKTGQNLSVVQEKLITHLLREHIFTPEFLNRFDATVVFESLSHIQVVEIAQMMLKNLRIRLEDRGYILVIGDELVQAIAEKGFSADFGARELRRFIQEKVENGIAAKIIAGTYKQGDTITLTPLDLV